VRIKDQLLKFEDPTEFWALNFITILPFIL